MHKKDHASLYLNYIKDPLSTVRKPQVCYLHLLNQCCMRCKMCAFWKDASTFSPIPLSQLERFFLSLKQFLDKPITVALGGGEPLIYKDIFTLIKILDELGFITSMTSNGYLINKAVARKIVDSNLKNLAFSLDSLNSKTHNYLRGRSNSFERIVWATKYLHSISNDLNLGIITIIMEKNIDDILLLADWIQNNNDAKFIHFQAIIQPFGDIPDEGWYSKDKYKELWPQDIQKLCEVIDSLIKLKEKGFYKIGNSYSQLEAFKEYFKNPQGFIRRSRICNSLDFGVHIDPYGKVYLCREKEPMGDICQDMQELYLSDKAQEIRKKIISCNKNCHALVNCSYEE